MSFKEKSEKEKSEMEDKVVKLLRKTKLISKLFSYQHEMLDHLYDNSEEYLIELLNFVYSSFCEFQQRILKDYSDSDMEKTISTEEKWSLSEATLKDLDDYYLKFKKGRENCSKGFFVENALRCFFKNLDLQRQVFDLKE